VPKPKTKILDPSSVVPPSGGTAIQSPRSGEADRVWLGIERKYRVAEYESLSISLGAAVSIEPGETIRSTLRATFSELKEEFADVVEVMRGTEGL
jgi:hypothetical protein